MKRILTYLMLSLTLLIAGCETETVDERRYTCKTLKGNSDRLVGNFDFGGRLCIPCC